MAESLKTASPSQRRFEAVRDNRLRALRHPRPHTVGYVGVCDQEQGGIKCVGLGGVVAHEVLDHRLAHLPVSHCLTPRARHRVRERERWNERDLDGERERARERERERQRVCPSQLKSSIIVSRTCRFRSGIVFKAHRLCVSLNSRLESNKEEEEEVTV